MIYIGHGRSSHLPLSAVYTQQKSIFYTKQVLDQMQWEKSCILGHSLGGAVGLGFASCFPEMVKNLVIIDTFGALPASADKTVKNLRKAIIEETKFLLRDPRPKIYGSITEAANTRVRNSVAFSKEPLSFEAAKFLVKRFPNSFFFFFFFFFTLFGNGDSKFSI